MIYISAGHHKEEKKDSVLGHEEVLINMLIRDECLKLMPDLISVPDDLTLKQTINWINERATGEDFALEIHCNANDDKTISGLETYYYKNIMVAKIVADCVSAITGINNRGAISDDKTYFGSLGFLRQVKCDNTLIECGYLTNPQDRTLLQKHETHKKIAEGIKLAFTQIGLIQEKKKSIMIKIAELLKELLKVVSSQKK